MKKYLFLTLCGLAGLSTQAQNIPQGYYKSIDGLTGAELKTAVYKVINPHTEVSSYTALPEYFQKTDLYPGSKRWWDMYSDIPLYAPNFKGLNREHSFPKSWWGGLTNIPAYVDLNHLYPSEAAANQAKSNYPLGVVDPTKAAKFDNGITKVGTPVYGQGGGASQVFEPDDEYKGDFARTYFYMATCYQELKWSYTYMVGNNTYPTLNAWSRELLLKWAAQDPVSQKERDRNEAIYKIQNNRNPFIDFPDLCDYIWGSKQGDPFVLNDHGTGSAPAATPTLITPVQDMELDFGQVAEGHSVSAKLHIKGDALKDGQNLTLTIYDKSENNGAKYCSIDGSNRATVSATAANSANGVWVSVNYQPTEPGEHTTRLVISGAGITGSVGIGMKGECLPLPTLTAPTALAPTDVTDDSYVANWSVSDDEVVDYWIVNRTRYVNGVPSTEQLPAEETYLLIEDFSGDESYTVQSVRLGIMSPESNSVVVRPGSIETIYGNKFGARNIGGAMLINCSQTIDALSIYDASGKAILQLNGVENNTMINLPCGLYILKANREVIKVILTNE